jgi:hypothetical protein
MWEDFIIAFEWEAEIVRAQWPAGKKEKAQKWQQQSNGIGHFCDALNFTLIRVNLPHIIKSWMDVTQSKYIVRKIILAFSKYLIK